MGVSLFCACILQLSKMYYFGPKANKRSFNRKMMCVLNALSHSLSTVDQIMDCDINSPRFTWCMDQIEQKCNLVPQRYMAAVFDFILCSNSFARLLEFFFFWRSCLGTALDACTQVFKCCSQIQIEDSIPFRMLSSMQSVPSHIIMSFMNACVWLWQFYQCQFQSLPSKSPNIQIPLY